MKQTQCPNCGSYHVEEEQVRVNSVTGKEYSLAKTLSQNFRGMGLHVLAFVVGGPALMVFAIVAFVSRVGVDRNVLIGLLCLFCLGGLGLAMDVVVGWLLIREMLAKRHGARMYKRHCITCNYRWQWSPGEPEPTITVNRELIRREEERRRRLD